MMGSSNRSWFSRGLSYPVHFFTLIYPQRRDTVVSVPTVGIPKGTMRRIVRFSFAQRTDSFINKIIRVRFQKKIRD